MEKSFKLNPQRTEWVFEEMLCNPSFEVSDSTTAVEICV